MILSKCSLIFVYNKFLYVIHDHREYRENQDAGINCKQDWAVFYFINNLLYHHWQPKKRKERFILLWSTGHMKTMLKDYFPINTWCSNCLGINKTWDGILSSYCWSRVFQDVTSYCQSCQVCHRGQKRRPKPLMIPMPLIHSHRMWFFTHFNSSMAEEYMVHFIFIKRNGEKRQKRKVKLNIQTYVLM